MTDLVLGNDNDLLVIGGKLQIFDKKEEFIRQRLMISLNTFTNTWFENINFGINQNLIFAKGTQGLLDQDIKTIITETDGVIKILSYSSIVDPITRVYTMTFSYETQEGDIVSLTGVTLGGSPNTKPIFNANGYWDYSGTWGDEEVWGGQSYYFLPDNLLTLGSDTLTYGEDYLIFGE
jgi:hypothetical protein